MFDVPIFVELLNYLGNRDMSCLARTCKDSRNKIIYLKKNRCSQCIENESLCLKRSCNRCTNKTCYTTSFVDVQTQSIGNKKRIFRLLLCEQCATNHVKTTYLQHLCHCCKHYSTLFTQIKDMPSCNICHKKSCHKCIRYVPDQKRAMHLWLSHCVFVCVGCFDVLKSLKI